MPIIEQDDRTSRRSGRSPRSYKNSPHKRAPKNTTKIISGHAMAIRDKTKGVSKDHKLYNSAITHKEFGADDNNGHDA